jgi:hypothetical membrane protein
MKRLYHAGLLCGTVAPWWWAAMIILCAALWPHYDHRQQFISELAAHGSPTQALMTWAGFYVTGLLYVGFGCALLHGGDTGRNRFRLLTASLIIMSGIMRTGTGYFPCEAGCAAVPESTDYLFHHHLARAGYILLTSACLTWGMHCRQSGATPFAVFSFAAFAAAIVSLLLLQYHIDLHRDIGLYQRIVTLILTGWIFVLATTLLRKTSSRAPALRELPDSAGKGARNAISAR